MNIIASILVVDDDSEIRQLFSTALLEKDYQVRTAATGREGLQMTRIHHPDLVLLDVRLPDIDGVEVCRQIKSDPSLKNVFVALCSGQATDEEHKVKGLLSGADEYLVKPLGIHELLARVQTLVRLRNTTAALRASEDQYRRLIDILPDAVCLIHPDGRLLDVNPRVATMLGYASSREILQKNIFEIAPTEDQDRIKADIMIALRTGIIKNFEYDMVKKDGTVIRVELNATVLIGFNHEPASLLSVVRDITEIKKNQENLQVSEARFRQLADHIQEVFWMTDPDKNQVIYVSPAYEKIWGQPCSSLYASPKQWIEAVHPDDRKRVSEKAHTNQVTGDYDEIYRIIRPDRTVRWIQDRAFPIRNAQGNVYRVVGIAEDITKRKQAWDSLGESEARKQAIMQAALDGIITIDHQGRMIELNSAAERIFALCEAKLIGENLMELIPPTFRTWFRNGLANLFAGGKGPVQGSRVEMPALRADGSSFPAEFTITQIKLPGNPMFTIYIRDITQRKRVEAELHSLPQHIIKAQEAERMRIAQELHDGINQLVASAKMRLCKVEDGLPDLKPAAREVLRRCDRLLAKVLEENRRIAHNLRPTELDQLGLTAACTSFCHEVRSRTNLQFQCRLFSPAKRLPSDIELNFFRIVQEALTNIEKHAGAKTVKLQIRAQANSVTLKIQDDGRGFDVKTTKHSGSQRHGFGLTNMRERALALGGNCEITSLPGSGTTIQVRTPLRNSHPH